MDLYTPGYRNICIIFDIDSHKTACTGAEPQDESVHFSYRQNIHRHIYNDQSYRGASPRIQLYIQGYLKDLCNCC